MPSLQLLHWHEEVMASFTAWTAVFVKPGHDEKLLQAGAFRRRPTNIGAFFRVSRLKGCLTAANKPRQAACLPFLKHCGRGTPVQKPAQCTETPGVMQTRGQSLERIIANDNKRLRQTPPSAAMAAQATPRQRLRRETLDASTRNSPGDSRGPPPHACP
jgi:hypothetical protein